MNIFSGSGITQQMYTRERRGVYRSTEGFDTVAKSESLDNNFVKKILHPFCLYDAPAELALRGEKDESQYPSALHLFHSENGETVVGCNRYVAADFTGQRSAFFAHNFVVPAARADEILHRYGDWLHADFAEKLAVEPGDDLPELTAIPVRRTGPRREPLAVLQALGIGETLFKGLLQAIMISVAGKKKIYISLDVPVHELSVRAVELTEILYSALPYEFRRRLGVITYVNEPKSRKYIHLTFVEKGALRPGDRGIEKDFVFDLASGRTGNVDFGEDRQPYADFVWKSLMRNPAVIEDFGRFADEMLGGESAERKISLAVYNELAVFYEIEQGNEVLYEDNKSAVLSGLLSYLRTDGALDSKVRLNDLFLERFDREFDLIRQKGMLIPAIMESFKEYFLLKGHTYRGRIVDYFINGLLNSQAAGLKDGVNAAYAVIESNEELSRAFFTRLLSQPDFRRILFEPYVESRLAAGGQAADVMSFVVRWGRFLPEALQLPFVRDAVRDYLLEKLQREKESVGAVAAIHETVTRAEKERRKGYGVGSETLVLLQTMASAADRYLLHRISLEEMSQEQLLEISFVRYPGEVADWNPPLDYLNKRKSKVLRAAYRWFGEEGPNELIFAGLAPQELDDVQLLGRRWLKEADQAEPFERLPLAFYYSSEREGGPLDYDALLDLIRSKAGSNKDTVYRFLAWSQGNSLFNLSKKKLQPGYRRAILKYFLNHDREAFKNREFRKSYADGAGPALQNVYNEARMQLASPLARWIRRSRFQLLIFGSFLGIILIASLILIRVLDSNGNETAFPETTPQPTAISGTGGQGTGIAPVSVYLKNSLGSNSEGVSRLLFIFTAADDYARFNPTEISVESSDGVTESYKVSATTKLNAVPSASASSGAAGADNNATASAEPQPSPTSSPIGNSLYQVEVALETNAALVKGSLIKAGGYTLTLMAELDAVPAGEPSAGATTEASASPATNAK
ncbi:glycosyltransferase [Paenibacillus sp. BR2-3]|uniref:GAP1-N2 domain-containing protein n=1 Tax=Paenibacillus sp. BR2-3 TaxID=3048494 RepID=UPI0039777044